VKIRLADRQDRRARAEGASSPSRSPQGITFEQKDGRADRSPRHRRAPPPFTALARALVANAVHGVTAGLQEGARHPWGVGYRAELKGKTVSFAPRQRSHPIDFPIPEGIQVAVEKQTHLVVSGADQGPGRAGLPQTCVRLRPPDPYKQKGVRITGERLKKKAGKAGAKAGGAALIGWQEFST